MKGISTPYTIAFKVTGSNNGRDWTPIDAYYNLKEGLKDTQKTFQLQQYSDLFSYIKFQSLLAQTEDGIRQNSSFGIRELDLYGVIIPNSFIIYYTQTQKSLVSHLNVFIYIFILSIS